MCHNESLERFSTKVIKLTCSGRKIYMLSSPQPPPTTPPCFHRFLSFGSIFENSHSVILGFLLVQSLGEFLILYFRRTNETILFGALVLSSHHARDIGTDTALAVTYSMLAVCSHPSLFTAHCYDLHGWMSVGQRSRLDPFKRLNGKWPVSM